LMPTMLMPANGLLKILLDVFDGMPVAVDARAPSPGINGEPFRRSPKAPRLHVPVIAGQIDGEITR
jgi:hypothetical protein